MDQKVDEMREDFIRDVRFIRQQYDGDLQTINDKLISYHQFEKTYSNLIKDHEKFY